MKRKFILILLTIIFVGCQGQSKKNEQTDTATVIDNNKLNEESMEKDAEVIKKFFEYKKCAIPSKEIFREKCIKYFGIDVDSMPDDMTTTPYSDHDLNVKYRYLKTDAETVFYYPEMESKGYDKGTPEEALEVLKQTSTGEQLWAYNALLFHDYAGAVSYFTNNPDDAQIMVFYYDYEGSKFLTKYAVSCYNFPSDKRSYPIEIPHLLFYNNRQRGFKKDVLRLFIDSKDDIGFPKAIKLQSKFLEHYYDIKVPLELKDECYCYITKLLLEYDEYRNNNGLSIDAPHGESTEGLSSIENFIYYYGLNFVDRIKAKKYYNDTELEKAFNFALVDPRGYPQNMSYLETGYTILRGRVEDKDGYVNMRKEADLKSEIVGTIADKSIVTVLKDNDDNDSYNNDMLKVRTPDGKEGYVHDSRLILYLQSCESQPISK